MNLKALKMPRKSKWREYAAPIICQVLQDTKGKSEKEIRKALRDAYPFGQRSLHPYKIWLDEVQIQRGFKKRKKPGRKKAEIPKEQIRLF